MQQDPISQREPRGRTKNKTKSRKGGIDMLDCGNPDCIRLVTHAEVQCSSRRSPSPLVQKKLTGRYLSPVAPRTHQECPDTPDSTPSPKPELYFSHGGEHIMLGVNADTFKDELGITRHYLYLSPCLQDSLANDFDFQNEDELLVVGDKPVVNKTIGELTDCFLEVNVTQQIVIIIRRRPAKVENDEDYMYITITASLVFDEDKDRIVAKRVSLQMSNKPQITYVEYDLYTEEVRIAPVFSPDTYLQVDTGALRAPSDDALDHRDVWVFVRHHYTGIHSTKGRVYFCTIQHRDTLLCVEQDQTIGLQKLTPDICCPRYIPDSCTQFLIEGSPSNTTLESVKYQGKYIKFTEDDECPLKLDNMYNTRDDTFKFKIDIEKSYEDAACKTVHSTVSGWARSVVTVSTLFDRSLVLTES